MTDNFELKHSGKKETFDTGATREVKENKGLYDCLPCEAIRRLAIIYEKGTANHGKFNYRKGIPLSSLLSSGLRHLFQLLEGRNDEDHAAQCIWNIAEYIEVLHKIENGELPTELDDRYEHHPPAGTYTSPVSSGEAGLVAPESFPVVCHTTIPYPTGGCDIAPIQNSADRDDIFTGAMRRIRDFIKGDTPMGVVNRVLQELYHGDYSVLGRILPVDADEIGVEGGYCGIPKWVGAEPGQPPARIFTYTGKSFDVYNPDPDDVCIEDIAHALANTCRFSGHTSRFYSVAEHCCRMSNQAGYEGVATIALMHDAAEAYLTDVPSPIKQLLPGYKDLEEKVLRAIFEKFGLDFTLSGSEELKILDHRMTKTEARDLMPDSPIFKTWYPNLEPFDGLDLIGHNHPRLVIKRWFLRRAAELGIS